MAGNRVDYIIDLIVSDEKLRKQMSKIKWEEYLGSSGKDFTKLFSQSSQEAAQGIKSALGGVSVDWGEILGVDNFDRLNKVVAKKITEQSKLLAAFQATGDTTQIERTIEYVTALGDALATLGSSFDAPSLGKSVKNFIKVLNPISAKIEALAKEPAKVEAAFDRIFGGQTAHVENMAKSSDKVFNIMSKIETATKKAGGAQVSLDKLTQRFKELKNFQLPDLSGLNTEQLEAKMTDLEDRWDALEARFKGKTRSSEYQLERGKLLKEELHLYEAYNKLSPSYFGKDVTDDLEANVARIIEKFENAIAKLQNELSSDSFAQAVSKQIADIQVSVSLSEGEKARFINEINQFVKDVSQAPIEKVKIGVAGYVDETSNPIEDKTTRGYAGKAADEDAATTAIVNKTKDRFDRINGVIRSKQKRILQNTKTWRKNMVEAMKIGKDDLNFEFGWDGHLQDSADSLFNKLQEYFERPENKLNLYFDTENIAKNLKEELNAEGISTSGSGGDVSGLVSELYALLRDQRPRPADYIVPDERPRQEESIVPENLSEETEDALESGKEYVKVLDETTLHVDKVIESLREFARVATKKNASKGSKAIAEKLTDIGAKRNPETGEIDRSMGINIASISNGATDADIIKMLQTALMTKDEMGKPLGATLVAELKEMIPALGMDNTKGAGKIVYALAQDIAELFDINDIETELVQQVEERLKQLNVWQGVAKPGRALAALGKVRNTQKQTKIPSLEDIDQAIHYFEVAEKNTDALKKLRDARVVLGDSDTDEAKQAFKQATQAFYEETKPVFNSLRKQWLNFRGIVEAEGRKPVTIDPRGAYPTRILEIPENAKIVSVIPFKGMADTVGSDDLVGSSARRSSSIRKAEQQARRFAREGSGYDFAVDKPHAKKDIKAEKIEYKKFKTQEEKVLPSGVALGAELASLKEHAAEVPKLIERINEGRAVAADLENTKQQLLEDISRMKVDDLPEVKTSVLATFDSRRTQVSDIIKNAESALKTNGALDVGNTSKLGQEQSALANRLQTLVNNIHNDSVVSQELADKISEIVEAKNLSRAELDALRAEANNEGNQQRANFYRDMLFDMPAIDKKLEAYKSQKAQVDENIRLNRGHAQERIKELEEANKTNIAQATQEAQTLVTQLTEIKNKLYAEAQVYAKILENPDTDESTRQATLGKIQQTLRKLNSAEFTFARIPVDLRPGNIYDSKQQKNVSKWNKAYTNQDVRKLESDLRFLEEQLKKEEDEAKKTELKKKIANAKRALTRRKKSTPENVTVKTNSQLTDIERKLSTVQSQLSKDEAQLKVAEGAKADYEELSGNAQFLEKYNKLLAKEKTLFEEINKLKKEGADEEILGKKYRALGKATKELDDFLKANATVERTAYAREEAINYQAQLITAYRQRGAFNRQIEDLEAEENSINKYGLKGRTGARALRMTKAHVIQELMNSDDWKAQEEELRAIARKKVAEEQSVSGQIFDKMVTEAMQQRGWDPKDKMQTKKFLGTTQGRALSDKFQKDFDAQAISIWKQAEEFIEARRKELRQRLEDSFKIEDGVLKADMPIRDEAGKWSTSSPKSYDIKQTVLDRIAAEKAVTEANRKPLDDIIKDLREQQNATMRYGVVGREDLDNDERLKEIERLNKQIEERRQKLQALEKEITDIESDDTIDDKSKSKQIKAKQKKIDALNQEIERLEARVDNRTELIARKHQEKEDAKPTLEEKAANATERLTKLKERLAKSEEKIAQLRAEYEGAKGTENETRALERLDDQIKKRDELQKKIKQAEENEARLNKAVDKKAEREAKRAEKLAEKELDYSTDNRERVGGIPVDVTGLATEETLRAIYELLGGDAPLADATDDESGLGRNKKDLNELDDKELIARFRHLNAKDGELSPKDAEELHKVLELLTERGVYKPKQEATKEKPVAEAETLEITPMENRHTLATDLAMSEQAEEAAKTLENALSKIDLRSSANSLAEAYNNFSQEIFDAEKLLRNPEYAGALEVAEMASMGLEDFPDVGKLLAKMDGLRGKIDNNATKWIGQLDDDALIKYFKQLRQKLTEGKLDGYGQAEFNKVTDVLKSRGLLKDSSKQETAETEKQVENKKKTTVKEPVVEVEKAEKSLMSIGRAINVINRAIGESTAQTPAGMAKAYEKKIQTSKEAMEAAKVLSGTPTKEIKTPFGLEVQKKLKAFQDAWMSKQGAQVPVKPEMKPGAVAEEVKENVAEVPAEASVEPVAEKKSKKKKTKKKTTIDETPKTTNVTTDEDLSETELNALMEAISGIAGRVEAMSARVSGLEDGADDDSVPSSKTSTTQTSRGGILGVMQKLATENTLQKVLSALGDIAKKNVGSGKPNSAQDLLEQFRRMLESDAWEGRERAAYLDLETGAMSNSITGDDEGISAERLKVLRDAYKNAMDLDAQVHTHADEDDPYFSNTDIQQFVSDFADGIKKQILLSKNNMTVLDMTDVQDVNGLLDALSQTEHNFEALAATADKFGAKYINKAFDEMTPQGLVKMLGIKGVESKRTKTATSESAAQGMFEEDVAEQWTAKLDPLIAKVQKYEETIRQALSLNYLDSKNPALKAFQEQQDVITQTIEDVKAGVKTYGDLELAMQKAADLGVNVKNTINQNKKLYVGTKEINSVNRQRDRIIGTLGADVFEESDVAYVRAYKVAYDQLIATHKQFADNNTLYNTKNQEGLRQQAVGVHNLGKQLLASINQAETLKQKVAQSGTYIDRRGYYQDLGGVSESLSAQEAEAENLQETMRSYVANTLKQGNIENVKFNASTQQLTYTFRTSKNTVADMVVQYNAATNALYAYNKEEKESLTGFAGFFKGMKGKIASLWQYTMGITSIHRVLSELRRGVQYIREIDSALTELKKVTNETEKTYDKFLDTAAKTADKVGSTIQEVVSSTADWARLGYNLEEAAHLAESTSILLNVSEFQSIEDATSALTSTLQAFGYTANESMNVVDVLNEVGNNFAISSDGIATALQDSASSLMAANNSYEEAVALIASANRVVQDPNSVGAALRTISLRLRGTSVQELSEAGEETDGAITSKSKLRSKIKTLSGVDILTDTGAYKSTYDILLEISRVWKDMSDIDQAALLEIIAGKTRSNTAAAILSNTTDLEEAYVSALNAEGSALQENEKYLDSIQGRIDLFNNSVQTMWQNTLDDEVIKWFIDLGTTLIKVVDYLGLIKLAFIGLGTIAIKKYFGDALNLDATTRKLEALQKALDKTGGDPKKQEKYQKTLKKLIKERDDLKEAYEQADEVAKANPASKRKQDKAARAKATYENYNRVVESYTQPDQLKETLAKLTTQKDSLVQQLATATDNFKQSVQKVFQVSADDAVKINMSTIDEQLADVEKKLWQARKELTDGVNTGKMSKKAQVKKQKQIADLEMDQKNLEDIKKAKEEYDKLGAEVKDVDGQINDVGDSLHNLDDAMKRNGKTGKITWTSIKEGAKSAGKAIASTAKSMLYMAAITTAIQAIVSVFDRIIDKITDTSNSMERLQDKFEEAKSKAEAVESEIQSLETELESTEERMKDLMALGSLTFVEQEELNRLKLVSEELKAQIALKEQLKTGLQQGANDAAIIASDKYLSTSFSNENSRNEEVEKGKEEGGFWGKLIGGILAVAGLGLAAFSGGSSTALTVIGLGMMGLGVASPYIGEAAGGAVAGKGYDSEETVEQAIDNMNVQRDKLIKARDEALVAYADGTGSEEAYNTAEQELAEYNTNLAKAISQIAEYRNTVMSDWEHATTSQKEWAISQGDILDAYSIMMGGKNAKSNAIKRVMSSELETTYDIKALDQEFKNLAASSDEVNFFEAFDDKLPEDIQNRLEAMGINMTDLKWYYLDWKRVDEETKGSVYDTVQVVGNLTDGIGALKSAFDEFNESGLVSASTLVELHDVFGSLGDAWQSYINIMASGTNSTKQAKEATDELLEAFLSQRLSKGPITDLEEYLTLIGQLQNLGVTNAKEYVDALQRTSAITDIAKSVVNDKNTDGKTEQELINQYIQKYEEEYGFTLNDDEKLTIEKAITAEKAKQNAEAAKTQQNELRVLERAKDDAKDVYDIANNEYQAFMREVNLAKRSEGLDEYEVSQFFGDTIAEKTAALNAAEQAYKKADEEYTTAKINSIDVEDAEQAATEATNALQEAFNEIGVEVNLDLNEWEKLSEKIDTIQNAYSTLSDAVTEYNENGFLTLDNLQALLSLEPEYLACLQMENGQLSINRQAMQAMVQAKLADAKATVVESAMAQLHELAARKEEEAINDSTTAASNAVTGLGEYASALGTVAKDAIGAAGSVAAFNAAVAGAQANELVDPSEIDAILSSMNAQLEMIDQVGASLSTNFNAIMGGDGSDTSTGGGGSGDTALDRIKNKYEGEISNLENQQTYIQNEIDRLEAEDQAVSRSYYEEQKKLEEDKIELLKQEHAELSALYQANPTQETADALWEVEHALQESVMRTIEFKQAITDLYVEAADKLIDAFDNSDDFLSDQQNFIDKYQELMELQGEVPTAGGFQEQIALEQEKMEDNEAELIALRQGLADAMEAGYIEEGSEEWVKYQDKIRAAEEAVLDNKIAIEQYRDELKQLSVDAFELVRNAFSSKDQYFSNQQDYMQGYADLLEAQGIDVPEELYEELIKVEQRKRANNVANLVDARQGLSDIEAAGYTAADEEWQDAYQKVVELEKAVQDNDIAMAEWAKTIRDMDFEKFERFIDRLDDINSDIENLRGLFEDEDVAFKDGTWTKEGITSLGLAYQQMVLSKQTAQEYGEKINELNESYKNGEMSEQEYYERLQELKDGQWDAINAYEDAKDAIVDMEEARIDMIEEGINEEIEAYEELIEVKKEELDAERDLYNFKKDVKKQTKDLAALDRRIASLSGSTADADIAELRKLQAERREMQEGLDDTIYNHAMDSQGKALDDEMTTYRETREDYLETLRDTLDDTVAIVEAKTTEILTNATYVLSGINGAAAEHGLTLSDALTAPWMSAFGACLGFRISVGNTLPLLTNEDGIVTVFGTTTETILTNAFGVGSMACNDFKGTVESNVSNIRSVVENSTSGLTSNLALPWTNTTKEDGPISTFSSEAARAINGAVNLAKDKANSMFDWLSKPWEDMTADDGPLNTFSDDVADVYDGLIQEAKDYVAEVNTVYGGVKYPSYTGTPGGGGSGSGSGSGGSGSGGGKLAASAVKTLQKFLNQYWNTYVYQATGSSQLAVDGSYGNKTKATVKAIQKKLGVRDVNGLYDYETAHAMATYWQNEKRRMSKYSSSVAYYTNAISAIPPAMYAEGTLGTKSSGWAITDESWIGEEITLAAGKNGQLQYLKKGSAVMPADISANLVEWGKLNPNMMNMSGAVQGVNLMSNYVNKPEIKLDIENLLKVERVDKDTLPDLEKLMDKKLDNFARQLNYSIKKFAK